MTCPDGLGPRGERFWAEVEQAKGPLTAGDALLLQEACRLANRLDRFDRLIEGDQSAWAVVDWPDEEKPAVLLIGSVVTEARQHVGELRQVVKALDLPKAEGVAHVSGLDELQRRRERAG